MHELKSKIQYKLWEAISTGEKPLGILHIFHGMAEHIDRYADFASYLNKANYIVVGMDVRGHGQTLEQQLENNIPDTRIGYFAKENGWKQVLLDQKELFQTIHQQYPKLKQYVLGHSMGSFFARNYIQEYPEDFQAAIIMGTGKSDDVSYHFARLILRFLKKKSPSNLIHSMAFGTYNRNIKEARTKFDWLSTDSNEVQKYIDDPMCGIPVTNGFYWDFMQGMKEVTRLEKNMKFERDVLFIAGADDPVGAYGKHVRDLYNLFETQGVNKAKNTVIIYPNMRHEILNEKDRQKVYEDILLWLAKRN